MGMVTAGFQKIQGLLGDWEGKDKQGQEVKTTFKAIASNTAVMETLVVAGKHEMLSLYSLDGDSILLLHYCPTNNQPRMRAVPPRGAIRELVFSFESAANLSSLEMGHEHKLVLRFEDENHITENWTWRENGKDTQMVFRFARVHLAKPLAKPTRTR
jgi:hypothetical protein